MEQAPLLVAIDDPSFIDKHPQFIGEACRIVAGFKIGLPFIVSRPLGFLNSLRGLCENSLWVADFKLADIGYVMKLVVSMSSRFFDAFIAHSFVGVEGALGELAALLEELGKKLILVYAMSHPGARDVYLASLEAIDRVVERVDPWGLVVGATLPEIVERAARIHRGRVIISPGVGAQGARPGEAICRGATYEIVGRSVTRAPSPLEALKSIVEEQKERTALCEKSALL